MAISKIKIDNVEHELQTKIENVDGLQGELENIKSNKANASDLTSHIDNKSNPHEVALHHLGVEAVAAELNIMSGVVATTEEINKLHGLTASTKELNYITGLESSVQSQIDGKSDAEHTHKYAGSSSAGGAATSANKVNKSLTVKLNSGTVEDTSMFTFDGSSTKVVNITASSVGAAESSHAHNDKYYTEAEIDSKISTLDTAIDGKADSSHTHAISDITNLQQTLDQKQATIDLDPNKVVITDGSGKITNTVNVTTTNLASLIGVEENIQTQLNGKAASSHGTHVSYGTSATAVGATASGGSVATVSRSDHTHSLSKSAVTTALGYTPPTGDTKVTQTATTTSAEYPLLASYTANRAETGTEGARFGSSVTLNPKASTITAKNNDGCAFQVQNDNYKISLRMGSGGTNRGIYDDTNSRWVAFVDGDNHVGLNGNASTATKLATARNITVNLASESAASFDGSAAVTPGVSGVLPAANGGTGSASAIVNAGKYAILRKAGDGNYMWYTNTANGAFYATSDNGLGKFGTLPVAQGGTGVTSLTDLATAMKSKSIETGSYTGTGSTTADVKITFTNVPKFIAIYGEGTVNNGTVKSYAFISVDIGKGMGYYHRTESSSSNKYETFYSASVSNKTVTISSVYGSNLNYGYTYNWVAYI